MKLNIITHSPIWNPKVLNTLFALSLGTYFIGAHPPLMFRLAFHLSLPHLIIQHIENKAQTYTPPLKLTASKLRRTITPGSSLRAERSNPGVMVSTAKQSRNAPAPDCFATLAMTHVGGDFALNLMAVPLKLGSHSSTVEHVLERALANEKARHNPFIKNTLIKKSILPPQVIQESPIINQKTQAILQTIPIVSLKAATPYVHALPVVDFMTLTSEANPVVDAAAPEPVVPVDSAIATQHAVVSPQVVDNPIVEITAPEPVAPAEPVVAALIPEILPEAQVNPSTPTPTEPSVPVVDGITHTSAVEQGAEVAALDPVVVNQRAMVLPKGVCNPVVEVAAPVEPVVAVQQEIAQVIVNNSVQDTIPIQAKLPGRITKISVNEGDRVISGQKLGTMFSMGKMKLKIHANVDGVVRRLHINRGEEVNMGQLLVTIEPCPALIPEILPEAHVNPLPPPTHNHALVAPENEALPQEPLQEVAPAAPRVVVRESALARLGHTPAPMNPTRTMVLDLLEFSSDISADHNEIRRALKETLLSSHHRDYITDDLFTSNSDFWKSKRASILEDLKWNINEKVLSFKHQKPDMGGFHLTDKGEEYVIDYPNEVFSRRGLTLFREDEVFSH